MNISELYKHVAQLGFESSLEDEDRFIYAANRALLQVNKIRPAISRYCINHKPMANLIKEDVFTPLDKTEDLTFEATNAKSYYFEADGNGVLYIEKYEENDSKWRIVNAVTLTSTNKNFIAYRGFIKDGGEFVSGLVRLRFTGDYFYSVKNVAMYEYLLSENESDIPTYEPYTRYNLSSLVEDFICLHCPPIREDKVDIILNQDYQIESNGIVLLSYEKKGVYRILYERRPNELVKSDTVAVSEDTTKIDLDEELCSLMPILVAAYVWVDDEPNKSEYYLNLYRERAAIIEQKAKATSPVSIKSTNGW